MEDEGLIEENKIDFWGDLGERKILWLFVNEG